MMLPPTVIIASCDDFWGRLCTVMTENKKHYTISYIITPQALQIVKYHMKMW